MTSDIKYYNDPVPHIIIDNLLSTKANQKCLEEAIKLKPYYKQASVVAAEDKLDDCNECKQQILLSRTMTRDNEIVFLNKHYKDKEWSSFILSSLDQVINSPLIMDYFTSAPSLFPMVQHTRCTDVSLSRYGKCDFYNWHIDTLPEQKQKRVLTLIYYFNKEPVGFKGGDFLLKNPNNSNYKRITPQNNRAIMIRSQDIHSVDTITLCPDFELSRFSINYWLGFN